MLIYSIEVHNLFTPEWHLLRPHFRHTCATQQSVDGFVLLLMGCIHRLFDNRSLLFTVQCPKSRTISVNAEEIYPATADAVALRTPTIAVLPLFLDFTIDLILLPSDYLSH